jgi:anti-anti-sigma regulatory factor
MSQHPWFAHLLTVRHPDSDVQRRGSNVLIITYGMSVLAAVSLLALLVAMPTPQSLAVTVIALLIYLGLAALTRRGSVTLASWLLTLTPLLATLSTSATGAANTMAPFYFLLALLIATATHRPRDLALTMLLTLAAIAAALGLNAGKPVAPTSYEVASLHAAALGLFAGLVGMVNGTGLRRAMTATQAARSEAEAAAMSLAEANAQLETRVRERTEALETALTAQRAQAVALEQALAEQRSLSATIAELSLPIIPVRDDTLVLPLVGALDADRLEQLHPRLLAALGGQRTRVLIIDVTGVPVMDTEVAHSLLQVASAARLMGTRVVVAGIRPEVAQALVALGVNLHGFATVATLQQGLERYAARS